MYGSASEHAATGASLSYTARPLTAGQVSPAAAWSSALSADPSNARRTGLLTGICRDIIRNGTEGIRSSLGIPRCTSESKKNPPADSHGIRGQKAACRIRSISLTCNQRKCSRFSLNPPKKASNLSCLCFDGDKQKRSDNRVIIQKKIRLQQSPRGRPAIPSGRRPFFRRKL